MEIWPGWVGDKVAEKLCQDPWAQRVVAKGSNSDRCLVRSDADWGLVAGPVLFNIFIEALDDRTRCTVMQLADDNEAMLGKKQIRYFYCLYI